MLSCLCAILLEFAVLLPLRVSVPPHRKAMLYFKMITRDRIQIPLHTDGVALFPVICNWSCISSAPKGVLGMKRRQEVFSLPTDLTANMGPNDTERRESRTDQMPSSFLA